MQLCSKYKEEPAIASYVWAWGETGFCCARYQIELNQIAQSLSRTVSFAPLSTEEIPMDRSERVKLKAESLVLEEELSEAKMRGADMYKENVKLTAQVQALTVRGRELEAQISDGEIKVNRLEQRLVASDAARGELADELQRLKTLQKFSPPEPQG